MWKKLKVMFLLSLLFLPVYLWSQSVTGGETGIQMELLKMRLNTCNQNWTMQSNENLKLINNMTISEKSYQQLQNKVKIYPQMLQDLQNKIIAISQEREQYKTDLINIKTDFDTVIKSKDEDISKWKWRCIFVTVGALLLTALEISKK